MRVQDSNNRNSVSINPQNVQKTDSVQIGRSQTGTKTQQSGHDDQVGVSQLGNLMRAASGNTADHSSRVSELAAQYKSGRYKVSASAVAGSMVNEAIQGR